ncbi:PTS glucose transporter subunit IIA [Pseudoalteromonas sp. CF6-2]|uniref:PTS glucose transporter subunit IIA n=1 Tax=unclassified Pseudoalteromonas TaxID=194690 RepID=UPI001882CA08|nr:PTS glucose transporter subunit IIA [Lelliottia steviae]UJX26940.1 PTS glucose transporter subunit IIA [Pseudoalteromonas sp. CF6-2]|tara:strand:+ start:2749 stop:3246 length:498 start_codon:yes stop_codon:yes gene_type:complete
MNKEVTYQSQRALRKNQVMAIKSPFTGRVKPISEHPEAFFRFSTLGPSISVELTSHNIVAPFDGTLLQVKNAGKEYILQAKNGLKILINLHFSSLSEHINHTRIAKLNDSKISQGQRLAYFDLRELSSPMIATLCVLNSQQLGPLYYSLSQVSAGVDTLLTVTKK